MNSDEVRAGIDVGTNAVKAVVARVSGGRIVDIRHDERRVTRLGEGLSRGGRLLPAAVVRTCEAVAAMAEAARRLGATRIRAGATSAAREATNTEDLVRCVEERCGVALEVLSGEAEAALTFRGVAAGLGVCGPLMVVDPGGGSTEWAAGRDGLAATLLSVPVGAVGLTEGWLREDPPAPAAVERVRGEIARAMAAAPMVSGGTLTGTGGTLHSMAAVHHAHSGLPWEAARVLTRAEVERQIAAYAACSRERRRTMPGLNPDRADIILAGALVVEGCLRRAGVSALTVTDYGLRHGLAVET